MGILLTNLQKNLIVVVFLFIQVTGFKRNNTISRCGLSMNTCINIIQFWESYIQKIMLVPLLNYNLY